MVDIITWIIGIFIDPPTEPTPLPPTSPSTSTGGGSGGPTTSELL